MRRRALWIGVTGGIGAGKSTLTGLWRSRGARVIDADREVHRLLRRGTAVHRAIVRRFGPGVLGRGREIDRRKLARQVFGDRVALKALNAIVHPAVLRVMRLKAEGLSRRSAMPIVMEIPLLVENSAQRWLDKVVTVEASLRSRLARLECRGMTRQDAMARMRSQSSPARRRRIADIVIRNDGDRRRIKTLARGMWGLLENRKR